MLGLNKPIDNNTEPMDPRIRAMAAGVILLAEALEKLLPKRRDNPLNYYPRLYNVNAYNSLDWKSLLFDFTYIRNERLYSFTLPAFIKLEERCPKPVNNTDNLKIHSANKFLKALYHPVLMFAAGFGAVANIFTMALTISKVKLTSLAIIKSSSLLFNLAGFMVSLAYFMPALLYYYNNDRLRDELLDIFNAAMADIRKDDCVAACEKLYGLKWQHNILLHPNYPDNNNLRWSYYYMLDLINEICHDFKDCESYKEALSLAETPDQKFLVLQGLLNVYDWRHEDEVKKFKKLKSRFVTEEERDALKQDKMHIEATIAPYVAQIDPTSAMHQQLQSELHSQLQQCVSSFRRGDYAAAKNMLDGIKWGGYCKKAYPGAAILYYQLQTVLTLCMEPYEPFDMESLCPIGRLRIARENLVIVQEYIDKYYPEMSRAHQEYIDLYDKFDVESDMAYEPQQSHKQPIIYSGVLHLRQDLPSKNPEEIVADIRNLYSSRSSSPINNL